MNTIQPIKFEEFPRSKKFIDMSGQRLGIVTVLGFAGWKPQPNGNRISLWHCQCDCGNIKAIATVDLRSGHTKSCGCLASSTAKERCRTHGATDTPEYVTWTTMLKRCRNPRCEKFPSYGARGISVCERWLKFENFIEDMGNRPSSEHSIDRIDNDGDYTPSNCHWTTRVAQARNKRNNHMVEFNGKTKCLAEWAEITGINKHALCQRLGRLGWSIEKTMTEPIRMDSRNRNYLKNQ